MTSALKTDKVDNPYFIWLRILIILLVVLGIFFRFVNLDRKIYWYDEIFTSLRVSGYTEAEMIRESYDGHVFKVGELQKYQRFNPERGVGGTLRSLAIEDSQHSPLYFVVTNFWVQWFGNSVAAMRSLTALFSLLAFPAMYWLCRELFDSPQVGWVAIALLAVSPFHVLYAQEAREYSLWTALILLSSAALLAAMRLKTRLSWGIYAVTLILSLYSFLFSGLVAIGHGIYVLVTERFQLSKTAIFYLTASFLALIAFSPWLWCIFVYRISMSWIDNKISITSLVKIWLLNLSRVFIDFDFEASNPLTYLVLPILGLAVYSLYFLCQNAPKRVWLFVLTLMSVVALFLILPDLLSGGRRASVARYFIPVYLGFQLAIAYLLATQILPTAHGSHQTKAWQIAMVALLSCGVFSCVISSQSAIWWNKFDSSYNPPIAALINEVDSPLIISDARHGDVISLSYLLEPDVQFQLINEPDALQISNTSSKLFLFNPSSDLKDRVEQGLNHKLKRLYKERQMSLWQVEP